MMRDMGLLGNVGVPVILHRSEGFFVRIQSRQRSIGSLVGFGEPGLEYRRGFVAEELVHGDAALGLGDGEFAVDEGVIETGSRGIGGGSRIENLRWTRPIDGSEAHGTGLTGGEKFAMVKLKGLKTLASFANGQNFRMSCRVAGSRDAVGPGRNESAVFGDDRSKRAAAVADVF